VSQVRSHETNGSLGRMASGGPPMPEAGCQRQPTSTSVTPTASLQRQPLDVSLGLASEPTLMGQLSNCLVVQHGPSSSLVSVA
jgi:hypothetical protein